MLGDIRKEKNISQNELAKRSGVLLRSIQMYEQGQRDINGAKLSTLISLCNVLNCDISDILTDESLIEECKKFRGGI